MGDKWNSYVHSAALANKSAHFSIWERCKISRGAEGRTFWWRTQSSLLLHRCACVKNFEWDWNYNLRINKCRRTSNFHKLLHLCLELREPNLRVLAAALGLYPVWKICLLLKKDVQCNIFEVSIQMGFDCWCIYWFIDFDSYHKSVYIIFWGSE